MTRKGKLPISIPQGVEVTLKDGDIVVKGPKGLLSQKLHADVVAKIVDNQIFVSVRENSTDANKFHGLFHTLIENMVHGITKGFDKSLEMIGTGYRAAVQGKDLNLNVGFSHPTLMSIPEGLEIKVVKNTNITVSGANKQQVGQFAATIRSIRPPEPYKGKGIRYSGEYVRKKAGKSASK